METTEQTKPIKANKKKADLTTRPLFGKIVLFALPLLLTSLLQLLYNAADLIVVGQWSGDTAMAAVGSTGALVNLIVNLFIGLSVGALSVTARYIGAKRDDKVSRTVHTSVSVSFLSGIVVGLIGFFVSKQMLRWMNTPSGILSQSALYLKIYFCGMPFNLLYNFGASILRANGDTKRPLLILSVAGLLNIGLNILTVAGFKMGVAGVGVATVASQALSAVGVVFFLARKKDATRLAFKKLRIHRTELFEILRVGLPAGVQGILFSLSNV
ncbi:MAG: MATE family efflux transporter, partial [Clostridiales bacterium]|nr:MATE family efflux transporter [Clostridiales bacterium]